MIGDDCDHRQLRIAVAAPQAKVGMWCMNMYVIRLGAALSLVMLRSATTLLLLLLLP